VKESTWKPLISFTKDQKEWSEYAGSLRTRLITTTERLVAIPALLFECGGGGLTRLLSMKHYHDFRKLTVSQFNCKTALPKSRRKPQLTKAYEPEIRFQTTANEVILQDNEIVARGDFQ
jgi:hypothetical protein